MIITKTLVFSHHNFLFYWSIVDLQHFTNLYWQQSDTVLTQLYIFFFSILFHYGLSQDIGYSFLSYTAGPCWLSIIYNSLYLPSLNFQFNPLPVHTPHGNPSQLSMSVSLLLLCRQVHLCPVLDFTYKWYHPVLPFSNFLSMIISGCIHVAANDIMLLFLWLSSTLLYTCTISSLSVHLSVEI